MPSFASGMISEIFGLRTVLATYVIPVGRQSLWMIMRYGFGASTDVTQLFKATKTARVG